MRDDSQSPREDPHDAAIFWWVRRKAGPLSREDQAAFDAWLAGGAAHKAAFDEISILWQDVTSLRPPQSRRLTLAMWQSWLAGAAILGIASSVLWIYHGDVSIFLHSDFYAGTGETKHLTLADGSHVELDAQSAIAVHYNAGQRRVSLLEGEAWFEVSPDPARPFVVEASGGTVTALGTAFDVDVEKAATHVTVTQHRVAVESGGENVVVAEGEQTAFRAYSAPQPPSPVDVARATAWRRGRLFFDNTPLGEVVAALGRYHHGKVYFANPELRERRVNGVFGTDDPVAAIGEIETSLGLHATYLTRYLIFLNE
ncbi:MAG TPA: FecR family protein [Methylocella sp.]|nr:FecR family protein [Methylocella sp.]